MTERQRRSSDEIRDTVLAAARELIREGSGIAPLNVDLSAAITAADVPRSSGYRAFGSDERSPQDEFVERLVESVIAGGVHSDPSHTLGAVNAVLDGVPDLFDTGSSAELATVFRELIRVVTLANIETLIEREEFRVYVSVLAMLSDRTVAETSSLTAAVKRAEAQRSAFWTLYRDMADLFGLRLRPGWTWETFDAAVSTAGYGAALRHNVNPYVTSIVRNTGPDGAPQEWSAFGVAFEGIVLTAAEQNPRMKNGADLSIWLD